LLYDAQTSGGLLISVYEKDAQEALSLLKDAGFSASAIIGRIRKRIPDDKKINIIR
ncbi:MAG: AIR synthase-related protein, partial [Atribacterota bacterium]|nr:AIR synthase-related protein [Atribacterota bacterium]